MPPDPNKVSGRYAPERGCQRQLTGVEIVAKKKARRSSRAYFFACYKQLYNLPSGCYRFRGIPSSQRVLELMKNLQTVRQSAYDP